MLSFYSSSHFESMILTTFVTNLAAPIPRFDGIQVDTSAPTREAGATSPPPTTGPSIRVPPLNPDDVNKFLSLFEKSDVSRSGILSGTQCPHFKKG